MPVKRKKLADRGTVAAFTLVELLVIVAVLAVVALCLVPALARTQPETRTFQCLNNYRQLSRAWRMYADDSNDKLAGVRFTGGTTLNDPRGPWVQGWLTWDPQSDNTNKALLIDPRYASLAVYCGKNPLLFKCPADQFLSALQRNYGWKERVRSVSANICVGGIDVSSGPIDPALTVVTKWSGLTNPKPADTWLLMDEHPDSINDGALFAPDLFHWYDIPGNYHDGGTGVAYADGRAEIHRWQASALNVPIRFIFSAPSVPQNDADILWMRARTPRPPGVN